MLDLRGKDRIEFLFREAQERKNRIQHAVKVVEGENEKIRRNSKLNQMSNSLSKFRWVKDVFVVWGEHCKVPNDVLDIWQTKKRFNPERILESSPESSMMRASLGLPEGTVSISKDMEEFLLQIASCPSASYDQLRKILRDLGVFYHIRIHNRMAEDDEERVTDKIWTAIATRNPQSLPFAEFMDFVVVLESLMAHKPKKSPAPKSMGETERVSKQNLSFASEREQANNSVSSVADGEAPSSKRSSSAPPPRVRGEEDDDREKQKRGGDRNVSLLRELINCSPNHAESKIPPRHPGQRSSLQRDFYFHKLYNTSLRNSKDQPPLPPECTFKPNVDAWSKKIDIRVNYEITAKPRYYSLLEKEQQKQTILNKKREESSVDELKGCTFHPTTNKYRSRSCESFIASLNFNIRKCQENSARIPSPAQVQEALECTFRPMVPPAPNYKHERTSHIAGYNQFLERTEYAKSRKREQERAAERLSNGLPPHQKTAQEKGMVKTKPFKLQTGSRSDSRSKDRPLMELDLNLGHGKQCRLSVKEGDSASALARKMAQIFQLDERTTMSLRVLIKRKMSEVGVQNVTLDGTIPSPTSEM